MKVDKPETALRPALKASPALRDLDPGLLDEIFGRMESRRYAPGEHLIRQGDPGDCMLVMVDGIARIALRGRDGTADDIGRFSAGDVVGELALVAREPRSADVTAESAVRALALPADDFHRIAGHHPELGMVLTRLIGERLGRTARDGLGDKVVHGYRVLRRIGRGGMAIVYEAERDQTGQRVALKMMSHRLVYEGRALSRFRQEADLARAFRHRNIARVYERFGAYNTEFLVMELCEGTDLAGVLKRDGPMEEPRARHVLGQIGGALQYVHDRGVVHRDVKPSNVMLLADGTAKVMDFGVARANYETTDVTRTTPRTVVGTLTYMPPEQLAGGDVDARADIYALACVAYELLTGKPPFDGPDIVELIRQKASVRLAPAAEIGSGISAELHEFLERGLQPDADNRPASLSALGRWARS